MFVCVCVEYEKRLMDEDETDREVSERCNYSSQQEEGEITTHSEPHTTLPVCVCVCVYTICIRIVCDLPVLLCVSEL